MEDNDEVVEESDVYLTKNLSPNLHIFQYLSKNSPLIDPKKIGIKARPNHHLFEIETQIDTNSKNFDRRKGELFAKNLENNVKSDEKGFNEYQNRGVLCKQSLKSFEVKPTLPQYCIALIRTDCSEVHLTPISSVIQFKPCFNYFDKIDVNLGKSKSKEDSEMESEGSQDESEQQSEIQNITMRFAGPDEDKLRKAREKSFNYLQQQVAKDQWMPINLHPFDSQFSIEERMSLIYNSALNKETANDSSNITSLQDFLAKIKYTNEQLDRANTSVEVNDNTLAKPSVSQIRVLPLATQVRLLLMNAKILSFDQILKLLMGMFDPQSVLKNVQMYALLVRGNWVVKSEILYNKEILPTTALSGIPTELLIRARDLIVWKFTQTNSLYKKDIFTQDKKQIPNDELMEILSQMASFDPKAKCWNFHLPDDLNFIEKYPDVVQRQQLLWTNRYSIIERSYSNVIIKIEDNNSSKLPQRRRRNSRKSSVCSNSTEDMEVMEAFSTESVPNINSMNSFCSPPPIKMKIERKSPVKTLANRLTAPPVAVKERRRSKGHKMAVFEINPTISIYPTADERKELVKCVVEKLKNSFCITSEDLRKHISENCSNRFRFDIAEEVLESVVLESAGFKVINKWPQDSYQQPLYAFTKFSDQYDSFRETLFEMFSDNTRVRVSQFIEKLKDRQLLSEKNSENVCQKLLKEYCIFKSSMYYLKGTASPI